MFSTSSIPGQQLQSKIVSAHGQGGRFKDVVVLRDGVVVAIRQDDPDCWLHAFHFSQPWEQNLFCLPQASAIAISSAEESRGPGHFTLILDSPSALLKGCVDDSLQLSQWHGRPSRKSKPLLSASDEDGKQAASSSTPICFSFNRRQCAVMGDSATQRIKLVDWTSKNTLIWMWPKYPSQIHQSECLCTFAYPAKSVRSRRRAYFLAVSDWARKELIILTLSRGHKRSTLDISNYPQPEAIFVHKHSLCHMHKVDRIPCIWNLNSLRTGLSKLEQQKLKPQPSITNMCPNSSMQSQKVDKPERDQSVVLLPRRQNPDHGLVCSSGEILEGRIKEVKLRRDIALQDLTNGKLAPWASYRYEKLLRALAIMPQITTDGEDADRTRQYRKRVGKGRKLVSEQEEKLNHTVGRESVKDLRLAPLRLSILQRAKDICWKASQGVLKMNILSLCQQVDSTPLIEDAEPRQQTSRKVIDYSKQLLSYCAATAAKATLKCMVAVHSRLKEEVRKSLTTTPDRLSQTVSRALSDMQKTLKQIRFIVTAAFALKQADIFKHRHAKKESIHLVAEAKKADSTNAAPKSAVDVHRDGNLRRPLYKVHANHTRGMGEAGKSRTQIAINKQFQSAKIPQATSTESDNTDQEARDVYLKDPMRIELNQAEFDRRRRRAMNEQSRSNKIPEDLSTCKPGDADTEHKHDPKINVLLEAEFLRRQRRGKYHLCP